MNRIVSEKAKLDEKELPQLTYGRRLYGRPNHASVVPARWWPQAAIRSRDACWYSKRPSPADGEKALARRSRRGPRRDARPFCKGRQKREKLRNAWPFRLRFPGGSC